MKNLAPLILFFCLPGFAGAIPDTFGNFFINPAGMRLEDFANQASTWGPNAQIKGKWGIWNESSNPDTSVEFQRLEMRAIVFGVEAKQVTVQKRNNRPVRFEVHFAEDPRKPGRTTRQVLANIRAWSGKEISEQKTAMAFENVRIQIGRLADGGLQVYLEPNAP